jgi:hypothetical protein
LKRFLTLLLLSAAMVFAADQVPFVATFTSSVPTATAPAPTCSGPYIVPFLLAGTGQATHLGIFTETQGHCLDPNTLSFGNGIFTITGTNGDTVFGTYYGQLRPTGPASAAIEGLYQITGGTGKFQGATGGGICTGTLDFISGQANDLLMKGTISRPN